MNRKTFFSTILSLVLTLAVFAALNVFAYAANISAEIGSVSLELNEAELVDGGYIVNVPITVTENPGFLTVGMEVTYPTEFTLTGWSEGTVFPVTETNPEEGPQRSSANLTSYRADDLALNPFTVMYFTYESNNTNEGELITLTFKVPENIELGEYEISAVVTDAVAQGEDANAYPETITEGFTVAAGTVDISHVHTITFLDKDGETVVLTGDYNDGETVVLPEATEYDHFTFLGWSDGENLFTENFTAAKSLSLTAVYEEDEKFTVEIIATEGGNVTYSEETSSEFSLEVYEGTVLTLKANAISGNYVFNKWYDVTTGESVDISSDSTIEYTVTKNAIIKADFISLSAAAPVRLVAFIGRGNMGYFTVGDDDSETTYYDEYAVANKATKLTAVAYDGYAPAYWVRFTQDSLTEVLVATGDVANVYPLGGSVYYQPVFKANGETVALYIDKATKEIIAVDEAPADYNTFVENQALTTAVVTVYDCSNTETPDENNIFTAYDVDGEVIEGAQNPAFGDNIIIKKTETNVAPLWTIALNDSDKEFVASYKDNFSFNYMFGAETKVRVYEKALDGEATPAISTIATWTEGNITRFTGLFALPEGYTLVNHGVMMSQNKEHLAALENNATGELNVTATTIVGRVSDNTENATPLFTIAKRLSDLDEVWYGRAFLVYTDGETTYVVYADDILPSADGVDIIEGDLPGNQEIYNPMYWDDSVVFAK